MCLLRVLDVIEESLHPEVIVVVVFVAGSITPEFEEVLDKHVLPVLDVPVIEAFVDAPCVVYEIVRVWLERRFLHDKS